MGVFADIMNAAGQVAEASRQPPGPSPYWSTRGGAGLSAEHVMANQQRLANERAHAYELQQERRNKMQEEAERQKDRDLEVNLAKKRQKNAKDLQELGFAHAEAMEYIRGDRSMDELLKGQAFKAEQAETLAAATKEARDADRALDREELDYRKGVLAERRAGRAAGGGSEDLPPGLEEARDLFMAVLKDEGKEAAIEFSLTTAAGRAYLDHIGYKGGTGAPSPTDPPPSGTGQPIPRGSVSVNQEKAIKEAEERKGSKVTSVARDANGALQLIFADGSGGVLPPPRLDLSKTVIDPDAGAVNLWALSPEARARYLEKEGVTSVEDFTPEQAARAEKQLKSESTTSQFWSGLGTINPNTVTLDEVARGLQVAGEGLEKVYPEIPESTQSTEESIFGTPEGHDVSPYLGVYGANTKTRPAPTVPTAEELLEEERKKQTMGLAFKAMPFGLGR